MAPKLNIRYRIFDEFQDFFRTFPEVYFYTKFRLNWGSIFASRLGFWETFCSFWLLFGLLLASVCFLPGHFCSFLLHRYTLYPFCAVLLAVGLLFLAFGFMFAIFFYLLLSFSSNRFSAAPADYPKGLLTCAFYLP